MTAYERRCRALLRAFPASYRSEREDEMMTTLLDLSEPKQRWPSARTVVDLLIAAMRTRGKLAARGRDGHLWIESLRLVVLVGLCVQAAFSVAVASHYWRDGLLFYAPSNASSPYAYAAVAGAWTAALVLVVLGRPRLAVAPAAVGSGWGLLLVGTSVANHTRGDTTPILGLAFACLGVVPFIALVATATRRATRPIRRSWLWLFAFVVLGLAMSLADDGVQVLPGGGQQSHFPPGGGLVTLIGGLWIAAALVLAAASRFDARLGLTMAVVSVPVLIYRLGVVLGPWSRDRQFDLSPSTRFPWDDMVVLAALAVLIVLLIVSSINTMRRTQRL